MKDNALKLRVASLQGLCDKIGIDFNNIELLHQALTHTSFANESKNPNVQHNERLEFLGDAVLEIIISEYLFRHLVNAPEGELTKARAAIVCEHSLASCAIELAIGEHLLLGKGEASSGGRERKSILADAFEAIIGAIYLDSGFENARKFVLKQLANTLLLVDNGEYDKDYKTLLQEVVQKSNDSKIVYNIIAESGPDHNKRFEVEVIVNSKQLGSGIGKSKKAAEQYAAKQALLKLNGINK